MTDNLKWGIFTVPTTLAAVMGNEEKLVREFNSKNEAIDFVIANHIDEYEDVNIKRFEIRVIID